MHYVTVPDPVKIVNLENDRPTYRILEPDEREKATKIEVIDGVKVYLVEDEPWTLYRFLTRFVFQSKLLGKSEEAARHVRNLRLGFRRAKPGDVVAIDSATVEAVRVFIKGTEDISPNLGVQLLEFMDAFKNATETKPEPVLTSIH